jgi:hypothetical protein
MHREVVKEMEAPTETDAELRDRLASLAPEGGFYSAEELGEASGDGLDVLAEYYGTKRGGVHG